MSGEELYDLAKSVRSRADFIEFAERLRNDLSTNRGEWQNANLDLFLGGLVGFASDMHGYYRNIGEEAIDVDNISWRIAADMLLAATVYSG